MFDKKTIRSPSRHYVFAAMLMLVSCAHTPHQSLSARVSECPLTGIDVTAPNFYQIHSVKDIDAFYSCIENALIADGSYENQDKMMQLAIAFSGPKAVTSNPNQQFVDGLEFQRNLWRQVTAKEKTPGRAQEAWMLYQQNNRAIEAANRASSSQASAAQAAPDTNNENYSRSPMTCVANGPFLNCQ